jgi:hypothetical protein
VLTFPQTRGMEFNTQCQCRGIRVPGLWGTGVRTLTKEAPGVFCPFCQAGTQPEGAVWGADPGHQVFWCLRVGFPGPRTSVISAAINPTRAQDAELRAVLMDFPITQTTFH